MEICWYYCCFGFYSVYVLAPNLYEAEKQGRGFIRQNGYRYNECRVYYDKQNILEYCSKDTGEIMDLGELYTIYTEKHPNREVLFKTFLDTEYECATDATYW